MEAVEEIFDGLVEIAAEVDTDETEVEACDFGSVCFEEATSNVDITLVLIDDSFAERVVIAVDNISSFNVVGSKVFVADG